MNTLYLIAKLDYRILIIHESDLPFVGSGERAFEVMCIQVDLCHGTIDSVFELAKHFKFNPWAILRTVFFKGYKKS